MDDISLTLLCLSSLAGKVDVDFEELADKIEKQNVLNQNLKALKAKITVLKETYNNFLENLERNEEDVQMVVSDEFKELAKRIFEERLNSLLKQANTNFTKQIAETREVELGLLRRLTEAQELELETIKAIKENRNE